MKLLERMRAGLAAAGAVGQPIKTPVAPATRMSLGFVRQERRADPPSDGGVHACGQLMPYPPPIYWEAA